VLVTEPELGRADDAPAFVWRFPEPKLVIASAPVGGGIGARDWIINAQVPLDYGRTDLDAHAAEIAALNRCAGRGVCMLTAASVERMQRRVDGAVVAYASVGLARPTWAADSDDATSEWRPGTINIVALLPEALSVGALVNAVMTVTEAKAQALMEAGVPATGTASDAVCVVTPTSGDPHPFAGPRSALGAPLARAVRAAVAAGVSGRP
jgi:adenosylcobinamide amidohydrolase